MSKNIKIVTLKDNNIEIIEEFDNDNKKYKIFNDDNIDILKKKIMLANENLPFENIYLFCQIKYLIDINVIYNALTNNGKISLNKLMLIYFLKNINNEKLIDELEEKTVYTFKDIEKLDIHKKEVIMNVPIGQRYINNYQYILSNIVNPYEVDNFDLFYESLLNDQLITTNRELLYFSIPNNETIIDNVIYFCNFENVIEFLDKKDLNHETIINSYFPFLKLKQILSLEDYNNEKEKLIRENKKLLDKNLIQYIENVNLFYEINSKSLIDINYENKGIQNLSFKIESKNKYILPIDIMFKIINSTQDIPFIKLNLSKNMENIYRLYSDKITNTGKKLPFLNKSQIFKLMKTIGKRKTVSFYINTESDVKFLCEFENNGDISVLVENLNYSDLNKINILIKQYLNPIIKKINLFFEKNGYKIKYFDNIENDDIIVKEIIYNLNIEIEKNINLNKIVGCLSSIFSIEEGILKNGIIMRLKRVNYFSEMDSTEAFIIENLNKDVENSEIVKLLEENFNLEKEKAIQKLSDVLSSMGVVSNLYKKKQIKQIANPGFLTKIVQEKFNNNIKIEISNINSLFYLQTIDVYINSIILLTQHLESIDINKDEIEKLCLKNKINKEITEVEDIKGNTDKVGEDDDLLTGELYFQSDKDEKDDKYFNTLFGLDSDDDNESDKDSDTDEQDGGANDYGNENTNDTELSSAVSDASSENESDLDVLESSFKIKSPISSASSIDLQQSDKKEIELGSPISSASSINMEESDKKEIELGSPISSASSIEPAEERVEEPAEERAEEPAEERAEEPAEEPAEEGAEEPAEERAEEPVEEPAEEVPEQISKIIKIKPKSSKKELITSDIVSNKLEKDITGMSLSNPNPFSERLEERDPKLFVINEKDGKYNAYSRQCQWNARRQPVILTDKEKEKIDKEHPGSYKHAIKYGSDPNKQYWYICPRYWSLTKNTSLTEEEVKSGDYGNVIPQNSKKVPKNASIFEFTDNRVHKGDNGEYIQHYPGFILKKDSHPDNYCLPCCFKSWDTPSQKKRREECEKNRGEKINDEFINVRTDGENYIKGIDKFPLEPNRWGFLPIVIQNFLRTDNRLCQVSLSNSNLKENHICILRQGVEINNKQSFLACIASAYKSQVPNDKIYTIKFIKNKLIEILNIDIFVTLQNGSLVDIFNNKQIDLETNIDIQKYTSSKLYKDNVFFRRLINSYENFINFLNSSEYIDYTYLWDLICRPNKDLFKSGLNLVILEMTNDDITDNVKLICPSNLYSNNFFDKDKKTLIIIKNGLYFEPIYTLLDNGNEFKIQRIFDLKDDKLLQNLKDSLMFISESLNKNCKLRESIPETYEFKQNKLLEDVINILNDNDIQIIDQILNYNGMVIALIINYDKKELYLPVFPSSLLISETIGFKYIDQVNWNSYEITKDFLDNISETTNEKILSKPKIKVEENGLLIGIITETNQFIGIDPPVQDNYGDDLIKINDTNYLIADEKTILDNNNVSERDIVISKINFENKMFTAFRNTIRILLGKDENQLKLEEIKSIIDSGDDYLKKLDKIVDILNELSESYIEFVNISESEMFRLEDIDICINNKNDCEDNKYCKFDKICKLLLSKNNLINGGDNSIIYYGKLSDELIRYKRIKNFILNQNGFIAFNKIDYNLNDNEIIILQSMLNQDYFDNNIIVNNNKYIENTSYYSVNPYEEKLNEIKLSFKNIKNKKKLVLNPGKSVKKLKINECDKLIKPIDIEWNSYFPINTKKIEYLSTNQKCSFKIIIDIMNDLKIDNDLIKIKKDLLDEYNKLNNNIDVIYNIFIQEGKEKIGKQLILGEIDLDSIIYSETYYLSNIDILILSKLYNLPIIFLSLTKLKENNKSILITNKNDSYYFINIPKIKNNENINYSLNVNDNKIKIDKNILPPIFQDYIENESEDNFDNYLKDFNN